MTGLFFSAICLLLCLTCLLRVEAARENQLIGAKVASHRFAKKVAFAIRCKDAVVMLNSRIKESNSKGDKITRKLTTPKQSSSEEWIKITDSVYCITSGLSADALYLVDKMKNSALSYRHSFGSSAPLEFIAQQASQTLQRLVSSSDHRPLAVNLILCSADCICSMNCQGDYELTRSICSTVDDLLEAEFVINKSNDSKDDKDSLFDSYELPLSINQLKQIYIDLIDAEYLSAEEVQNRITASVQQHHHVSSFILRKSL